MPIALYEPDIPQNTGTLLRLCACLGIEAHIIGPAGFPTTDRAFRRAGMDYLDAVAIVRHTSWQAFETWRRAASRRLVLFTTAASTSYLDYNYRADDMLLFGREFGRCAARGSRCGRRPSDDPDASRLAFAQCRTRRRHGCRRDEAANCRLIISSMKIAFSYASTTPAWPLSTAKVFSVAMSAFGSCASDTTRMRTCIWALSRSTQT